MQKTSALHERLQYLMKVRNIKSFNQLAFQGGMRRQTLQSAAQRGTLPMTTADKLCHRLKIRPEWLLFGNGPMDTAQEAAIAAPQQLTMADTALPTTQTGSDVDPELYAYIKKAKTRLSAGGGTEAEEGFESERFGFLKSWLRQKATSMSDEILFLIDVEGDSMLPTFVSKDMVLVDKGVTELRAEGYFAIGEGNFINIKRLKREDDSIHIISDNLDKSMYPTRIVDGESLRIIGRVIWVGREIP